MMTFIVKKRRFKFSVYFTLEELMNVPYINTIVFAKVKVQDGGNFCDHTPRVEVQENNCVRWNKSFEFPCKISGNSISGLLENSYLRVSVRKEIKGGKSYQKVGFADINLSEYAGNHSTTRRYLLEGYESSARQDNSMIQVTIGMQLASGGTIFKAPKPNILVEMPLAGETDTIRPAFRPGDANSAINKSADPTFVPRGSKRNSDPCDSTALSAGTSTLTGGGSAGGSVASGSSGFGSLPRKERPSILTSDLVSRGGRLEQEEDAGAEQQFEAGHSRNSSYNSQHSRGYVSGTSQPGMHSRQSSYTGSELGNQNNQQQHQRIASDASSVLSDAPPADRPKPPERRARKKVNAIDTKDRHVERTRVDANELVDQIIMSTNLEVPDDSAESSGLRLFVAKDGSTALGSQSMVNRMTAGTFKQVIIDNR